VKIWRRQSEWDYSWIARVGGPAEVILCSICEYSRFALQCLPEKIPIDKDKDCVLNAYSHLFAMRDPDLKSLGPILFLGLECSTRSNFLLDPYRLIRRVGRFDPETFLRRLDDFSGISGPKRRGAGARVRQAKTALKTLGALKLLQLMSAREAIGYTDQLLGRPLFAHESQWSRARHTAEQVAAPYHAEAAVLLRAIKNFALLFGKS
jgi:hypothetical protein